MNLLQILILGFLLLSWLVLLVGGLCQAAGRPLPTREDEAFIAPEDLRDETPCAWCQQEKNIQAQPEESHGICRRHAAEMMEDARRINALRNEQPGKAAA